jgi:hypothetical protein
MLVDATMPSSGMIGGRMARSPTAGVLFARSPTGRHDWLIVHQELKVRRGLPYALSVTKALIPIASRISCNRAIDTVWYSVSS